MIVISRLNDHCGPNILRSRSVYAELPQHYRMLWSRNSRNDTFVLAEPDVPHGLMIALTI